MTLTKHTKRQFVHFYMFFNYDRIRYNLSRSNTFDYPSLRNTSGIILDYLINND